jgi:hypothetical protein
VIPWSGDFDNWSASEPHLPSESRAAIIESDQAMAASMHSLLAQRRSSAGSDGPIRP